MRIKANLHFHTADDPEEHIPYSTKEGLDRAAGLGFTALALTCHNKVVWTPEYATYAKERGVTLISGIEIYIGEKAGEKRHLVLLNCNQAAERVRTFKDLEQYKKSHPEVFVLVPHPFYPHIGRTISMMEYTERYAHLFDAIEHSWFYTTRINKNIPAQKAAERLSLPLVATSDTHAMDFFDTDYCNIEADDSSPKAILEALRAGTFENVTRPKKFISEFVLPMAKFTFTNHVLHPRGLGSRLTRNSSR